jgi:hypothetical protein
MAPALRRASLAALFVLSPIASAAPTQAPIFDGPELYAVGNLPMDLAVGHLDADTDADLAVSNRQSNDVSILWSPGGALPSEDLVPIGGAPRSIAVGDLDGDGFADVVVGRELLDPPLVVLFNRGDRTFDPPAPLGSIEAFPDALWIGDLDADSDRDVVLASAPSNLVIVMLNDGSGGFLETPYAIGTAPSYPSDLGVGDADDDGDPDLVVAASLSPHPPALLLNAGDGTFVLAESFTELSTVFVSAAAEDLSGDGTTEIALLQFDSVAVFPNEGEGSFGAPSFFPLGASAQPGGRIRLGDLDEDGEVDAVIGLALANPSIPVLRGNGAGGFLGPISVSTGAHGISGVELADLDADGDLDLAATAKDDDVVVILRNLTDPATSAPAPALPSGLALAPPRPNPGSAPTIEYSLPSPARVLLSIHDVAGRTVARLVDAERAAGTHSVSWSGVDDGGERAAAGVYAVRLQAGALQAHRTLVLTR